ncbi:MAG: hypothetical protein SVR94_03220 [Pseudomonadota bacterium]|nr:hypothetical protein [Pseudomonadota bacterium]
MTPLKTLFSIIEIGGYPDFNNLYQHAGYQVTQINSMRKALALLKTTQPQVIVAEFIFNPKHGMFISNVDSLLALIAAQRPHTHLIFFVYPEELHHLEKLRQRYTELIQLSALCHPITAQQLCNQLNGC